MGDTSYRSHPERRRIVRIGHRLSSCPPALVWGCVALQHQSAVLRRSGTRCQRFRPIDRLFWTFMSWWSPASRDALKVIQPETDLRWRRHGIALTWKYRSRGRRRGGRPGIARETRRLIREMAHANFLWGAPRIHGELLKLGTTVSQATYRDICCRREKTVAHRRSGP
jgi:putative transposase